MTDTLRVGRKDLTASEILDAVDLGNRVVIEVEFLGATMRMAIRKRDGTYYCDTPVKLLTYDNEEEMRKCLKRYKLAKATNETDEIEVPENE